MKTVIKSLSYSQLSNLRDCPAAYRYEYLVAETRQTNEAMERGSMVEELIALEYGYVPDVVRKKYTQEAWEIKDFYFKQPQALEYTNDLKYQSKIEIVPDETAKKHSNADFVKTWDELQEECRLTLDPIPVPIVGYVDFLTDDMVIDLKVSARANPSPGWAIQLGLYALLTGRQQMRIHQLVRTPKGNMSLHSYPHLEQVTLDGKRATLQWISGCVQVLKGCMQSNVWQEVASWKCAGCWNLPFCSSGKVQVAGKVKK